MKLKKLFILVIIGFVFFSGGIDCMAINGHGYDENRLAEFGWKWNENQNAYINECSAKSQSKDLMMYSKNGQRKHRELYSKM